MAHRVCYFVDRLALRWSFRWCGSSAAGTQYCLSWRVLRDLDGFFEFGVRVVGEVRSPQYLQYVTLFSPDVISQYIILTNRFIAIRSRTGTVSGSPA